MVKEKTTELEKAINDINIEAVKIIGTFVGTKDKIELIMDVKDFFEWVDKLKEMKK